MKKFSFLNSYFSFLNSHFSIQRGFSLVELLVVMGVITILSTIILSIMVTVLRGSKKSDAIILVKQDGENAMSQAVKMLRFAKSLDYPSTIGGTLPACSPTGAVVQTVRITNVDLTQTTFICPVNPTPPNYISLNGSKLTNSSTVAVTSCNFTCFQSPGGPPTIKISFSLSKINSSGLPEANSSSPFQSSVTLRNISN